MQISSIKNILPSNCQKCMQKNYQYRLAPLKNDVFCKKILAPLSLEDAKKYLQEIRAKNMSDNDKTSLILMKMRYLQENQIIKDWIKIGQYFTDYTTENIAKIMKNKSINKNIILYRGFALDDFGYNSNDENTLNNFYKKGKIFTYPIFLSTSLDINTAAKFPWEIKKNNKYVFKIHTNCNTRGIYLENMLTRREKEDLMYDFSNEEEVFLDRLLKLEMLDKYKDEEGRTIIECNALGHEDLEKYKELYK